jgi:hypothetical protein
MRFPTVLLLLLIVTCAAEAKVPARHGILFQAQQKDATVDPAVLTKYVGAYRIQPGAEFLVTLDGTQLNTKLGNQPILPVFPQSQTMFFAKAVDAQIEFAKIDAQGVPAQLILHQNGNDVPAARLSDAEFRELQARAAAFEKRFKDQTADPGTEAAVRRMIEESRSGTPNYDLMSPQMKQATEEQLPQIQSMIKDLGKLVEVKFTGVGPGGMDIYNLKFENGNVEYRIALGPDDKTVVGALMRPN